MKILYAMLALNEIDYIEQAVKSVRSFCDEIWVIEGCTSRTYPYLRERGIVTEGGLSTDGTTEWIRSQKDIVHQPVGQVDMAIEKCYTDLVWPALRPGDFFWIGTGNEIYFPEQAAELEKMMRNGPCLLLPSYSVLWKCRDRRIAGGGWDGYHPRCIPIRENRRELGQWEHDFMPYPWTEIPHYSVEKAFLKLAYARSPGRVRDKIALQEIEHTGRPETLPPPFTDTFDFVEKTSVFFTEIHDRVNKISVIPYNGPWPKGLNTPAWSDLWTMPEWEGIIP